MLFRRSAFGFRFTNTARPLLSLCVCLLFLLGSACTSILVEERAQKREDINRAAQETIDKLVEREPGLHDKIDAPRPRFYRLA